MRSRFLEMSYNRWPVYLVCVLLPVSICLYLGVDRNFDLANYHLYGPHAWVTGRYQIDIAAAQIQTWLNPLIDLPLYLLLRGGASSLFASLWLTVPAVVASIALVVCLGHLMSRSAGVLEALFAVLIGLTGAAMMPTIGATTNDAYVAAGMLTALAIAANPEATWRGWVLAGLLGGFTTGLKLTAGVYCIALIVCALVAGPVRGLPSRLIGLAVGGLSGFLLAYGPWALHLWSNYANPVFPFFNNVFQSPYLPAVSFADARFRVSNLSELLRAPVDLLVTSTRFSELPARDPRLLIGAVSAIILLLPRKQTSEPRYASRTVPAFFLVSLLLWPLSGILRYTTPIEMLSGALLAAVLSRLGGKYFPLAAIAISVLVLSTTVRPDWGRRPFDQHFIAIDRTPLPEDSMIIIASGSPISFYLLAIPEEVPAIAVFNNIMRPKQCGVLQVRAEKRIRDHRGRFWLLEEDVENDDILEGRTLIQDAYGLQTGSECVKSKTSFGRLRLCPLQRREAPLTCPGA